MASRKRVGNSEVAFVATKLWKETPPGPEQKELNRMFETNMIDRSQTPNPIRLSNPLFMAFNFHQMFLECTSEKLKLNMEDSVIFINKANKA